MLQYDDVMNQQRELIYAQRREVLTGQSVRDNVGDMLSATVERVVEAHCPAEADRETWDIPGALEYLKPIFLPREMTPQDLGLDLDAASPQEVEEAILRLGRKLYEEKEREITEAGGDMREAERGNSAPQRGSPLDGSYRWNGSTPPGGESPGDRPSGSRDGI